MEEDALEFIDKAIISKFNRTLCLYPELENITELVELCSSFDAGIQEPFSPYLLNFIQIFYGFVCFFGLLGNSLVIYVVLRFSKLHTVTNTYILHLALADELFLIGIPFLIATSVLGEWPFGGIMCKIYFITTSINQITSSLFLMVLSADRYVAVCHPISSPRFRTSLISKIVSFSTWLLSAVLMLPVFLYADTITKPDGGRSCNIIWEAELPMMDLMTTHTVFTFYTFIFGFAGPLLFILLFYGLVLVKLCLTSPSRSIRSPSQQRLQGKVTKLVLTVITVYIFCLLPHWSMQLLLMFNSTEPPSSHLFLFTLLSNCLQYLNSAINPVLYAFLSDNFKKSFRQACYCYSTSTAQFIPRDFSFTTRRTRRGPRFTAVLQDESCSRLKDVPDHSTGVTSFSRSSKSSNSCSLASPVHSPRPQPVTLRVVSGRLAPPTARL